MSSFFDFLRCILCCEEEDPRPHRQDIIRLIRNRFQNPNDYTQVPNYDDTNSTTITISPHLPILGTIPRTSSPQVPNYYTEPRTISTEIPNYFTNPRTISPANYTNQSNAQTFTRIQSPISSVASNFRNTSTTPTVAKPKTETTKRPQQPQVSVANSTTDQKPNLKSSPKPPPSLTKPPLSSSKPAPSLSELPPPSPASSSSSFGTPQLSIKPTLSQAPFNSTVPQAKTNYIWVEKGATPLYMIPEDIKGLIEKDIVPGVLKKPLSPSTYTDYFAALLYAEDYYLEKWDGFEMKNVKLELHKAAIYGWKSRNRHSNKSDEKDDKVFVAFEIDSVPERRPFLLSRDFASVRPSGTKVEPFQGIIYRVVKSNLVLVDFGEDFYSQHYSSCKYDVKFSFNRVCLKRAHQAIAAATDVLFRKFLFPERVPNINRVPTQLFVNCKLDTEQVSAVQQILSLHEPPPYLVEGPPSVYNSTQLSKTGVVVREAVLQICRTSPSSRILICAPLNNTCDVLMRSLQAEIPESDMFRANAAFREVDGVPVDILPSCLYKGECFSCPSLKELKKYKVISSTFMSSFRLRGEGIVAGHFSHVFLVDASSTTEPETMVPLANLANERTAVVVTGAARNRSGWVHSNIARRNGLMISYFERLRESVVYESLDHMYITQLKDVGRKSNDRYNDVVSFY